MKYNKMNERLEIYEQKQDIIKLEKFYVDAQISNLPELVEQRKQSIVQELCEFKEQYMKTIDVDGNEIETKKSLTPYVISNHFFRSITGLSNIEPKYSGEHLAILWDLYNYMVEQVNLNLCEFTPNLSHFCKFIGITTNGFKKMKNSPDEGIRVMFEKICDACFDEGVTMAQLGKHNSRATVYRMKSELDRVEKEAPQVTIVAPVVDLDSINKRISEISNFNNKTLDWDTHEE